MAFCKDFNARTQKYKPDTPMAMTITAFKDKTFEFTVKSPSVTWYLKKASGIESGSGRRGHVLASTLSLKHVYEIAKQNALAALEVMRGSVTMSDQKDPVICPKPRRVGVLCQMPMRPLRWHLSQQAEGYDSKAGAEIQDIIFKESIGEEQHPNQVASSPPYFVGSPPVRAANPVIQDSRFGYEKLSFPSSLNLSSSSSASGLSSPQKGVCVRMKLGLNPAAVRVEGFDCHVPAVS